MRMSKMIQAVDTHACGEPGRVIIGGVLDVPGSWTGKSPPRGPDAWIVGFASYVVDPEDPFPNGYTVGDIWGAQED